MGGGRTGSGVLSGLIAAGLAALGGAALAAAAWTQPYRLSPADGGLSADCPQLAVNGAGDASSSGSAAR